MILPITVERVLFPKADDTDGSWYLLATNRGICKGAMAWRPNPYSNLILDGEWVAHRGERQFAFGSAMLDIPTDPRAQLHYVCQRTQGIGPSLEIRIWESAGVDWKSIESGAIPRLKGAIYEEFRIQILSLENDGVQADVMAWLISKGATQLMAASAWERWKTETTGVVTENPYQLADLPNRSFRDVDGDIRKAFEIGDADENRIRAAITYSLRKMTDSGSTVIAWSELKSQTVALLGGHGDLVTECTRGLFADGTLKGFSGSESVALGRDYRDEMDILDYVMR